MYAGGFSGLLNGLTIYGAGFNGSRVMNTGTPTNALNVAGVSGEYVPFTEFKNGATDWLFGAILQNLFANMGSFNINTFPAGRASTTLQGSGPSGMIVDNASASVQASSIYFGVQGNNTAVKLTQVGFQ
jgi:hypothetical protein